MNGFLGKILTFLEFGKKAIQCGIRILNPLLGIQILY